MNNKTDLFLNDLKKLIKGNNKYSDELLKNIIEKSDNFLTKSKTCKVCNKKYNSKNRYYGSSCMKKLYNESDIQYYKEIDDKELFLHSAVIVKLGKEDLSRQKMKDVCQSYFSLNYFKNNNILKNSKITSKLKECVKNDKKPIMKLNTAYRLNRIAKNNEDLLTKESDERDEKIDSEILKLYKRYFTLSKLHNPYNYEIYYYMQILLWEIIIYEGKKLKYDLSSKLLLHSLNVIEEKPKNLVIKDKETIKKIKSDNGFKKRIGMILDIFSKDENVLFTKDTISKEDYNKYSGYDFNHGDLFYALHSVNIELKGKKKNKWNLKIKLNDRYDFTRIRLNDFINKKNAKYLTTGNILNDMGAISSTYGVIKEYDIIIEFDWNDFYA